MILTKPTVDNCWQVVEAFLREINYHEIRGNEKIVSRRQQSHEDFLMHVFELHGDELFVKLSEHTLDKIEIRAREAKEKNVARRGRDGGRKMVSRDGSARDDSGGKESGGEEEE